MLIRLSIFFVISFWIVSGRAFALDQTSMRMKGLGTSLQGIISDDFTDLLANPARQRLWPRKQLTARIGGNGNPIGLSYSMPALPFFLLAEGSRAGWSSVQNTASVSNQYYFPNIYAQQSRSLWESSFENYALAFLSGFGADSFGLGFGLNQDNSSSWNRSESIYGSNTLRASDGQFVRISDYTSRQKDGNYFRNSTAILGLHWRDGVDLQKDKDLIFKLSLPKRKTHKDTINIQSDDYDPDGNGDMDWIPGNATPTPNNSASIRSSEEKQNSAYSLGGGIEWRSRKKHKDSQAGYLVSLSYQPEALTGVSGGRYESRSVSGTSTTIQDLTTLDQNSVSKAYSYSGAVAAGSMWFIQERIWVGFGFRAEGTYKSERKITSDLILNTGNILRTHVLTSTLDFPLSFELPLARNLAVRGNITSRWSYSKTEQDMANAYFAPMAQTTTKSNTSTSYGIGAGYQWNSLILDLFTTNELLNAAGWQLQCSYRF